MTVTVAELTSGQWSSSAAVVTASVSPSGAGKVLVVVNSETNNQGVSANVVSMTGLGVTWAMRSRNQYPAGAGQATEVWWADVTPGTSGQVTVSFDRLVDDGTFHVLFAQTDTGVAPPWDTNTSLPKLLNAAAAEGTASTDSVPFVLIFAGSAIAAHNTGPTPVTAVLSTVSNGGAVLWEFSDVWGAQESAALAAATVGVSGPTSKATITVDALTSNLNWAGTAPTMFGTGAATPVTAPPFLPVAMHGSGQMDGLAFPLVGAQETATVVDARLAANPVAKLSPTRAWSRPFATFQRSGTVKRYVPPPVVPLVKVGAPPSRAWAAVAFFSHIEPRPAYGQIWPRGAKAGPPA